MMLSRRGFAALGAIGAAMTGRRPDQYQRPPGVGQPARGAGFPSSNLVNARRVVVFGAGNNTGVFVYSGTPALGNLVESVAAAKGTDPYGNPYGAGFISYVGTTSLAMDAGGLIWADPGNLAGAGGLIVETPAVGASGVPAIVAESPANSAGAGNTSVLVLIGQSHDASQLARIVLGNFQAGGAVLASTTVIVVGQLVYGFPGFSGSATTAETWHNLALVNGWTGTARYRLLPDGRVELDLALNSAAATAFQFSTMPASYIPANTVYVAAGATANVAATVSPYVQVVGGTGVVSMNGLHAFSAAGIFVAGGSYPLT